MTAARLARHGSGIWTADDVDRGVTGSENGRPPRVGGPGEVGHPGLGLAVGRCSARKAGRCAQWRPEPPLTLQRLLPRSSRNYGEANCVMALFGFKSVDGA